MKTKHFKLGVLVFPISLLIWVAILWSPVSINTASADEGHPHEVKPVSADQKTELTWQEKLRQQIDRENAMEGRSGQRDKIDAAMKHFFH